MFRQSALLAGGLLAGLAADVHPEDVMLGHIPDNKAAPDLEDYAKDDESMSSYARAASSDARVVSGETAGRLDADRGASEGFQVHTLRDQVRDQAVPISNYIREAKKQNAMSETWLEAENRFYKTAEILGVAAIKDATKYGQNTIQDHWANVIKELQEWKMAVLHPPVVEARKAAAMAQRPMEKSLQIVEKRISEYQQRASGLSAQALALRAAATGTANGAVAKQAGGDLAGAAADMMNAHQMMSQASLFSQQAEKLQLYAAKMQVDVPGYQGSAQMAWSAKMHQMAPEMFAPPPVPFPPGGPSPPNPPAVYGVFLSEANLLRHQAAAAAQGAGQGHLAEIRRGNPFGQATAAQPTREATRTLAASGQAHAVQSIKSLDGFLKANRAKRQAEEDGVLKEKERVHQARARTQVDAQKDADQKRMPQAKPAKKETPTAEEKKALSLTASEVSAGASAAASDAMLLSPAALESEEQTAENMRDSLAEFHGGFLGRPPVQEEREEVSDDGAEQ